MEAYVEWFNTRRLHSLLEYHAQAKVEVKHRCQHEPCGSGVDVFLPSGVHKTDT